MHVTVTCTGCSRQLRLPREAVGNSACCPLCKSTFLTRLLDDDRAEAIRLGSPGQPLPSTPLPAIPRMELEDEPPEPIVLPVDGDHTDALEVLPSDPVDEDEALEVLPADPAPSPRPHSVPVTPFAPVSFILFVRHDPEEKLEGRFQAEIDPEGLRFWRGRGRVLQVAPGATAEHLGGARLAIEVEGRRIEVIIIRSDGQGARLAADIVAFLTGAIDHIAMPAASPWPLVPFALLSFFVPLLGVLFGNTIGGLAGGLVWGVLAALVTSLCLLIAFRRTWSFLSRALGMVVSLGFLYLTFAVAFILDFAFSTPPIPAHAWQVYSPADGSFRVEMPGAPRSGFRAHPGMRLGGLRLHEVRFPRPEAFFSVAVGEFPEQPRRGLPLRQRVDEMKWQILGSQPGSAMEAEHDLPVAGYVCKQITFRAARGLRATARIYAGPTRLYVVLVGSPKLAMDSPEVRRFFDSFSPGPAPPAEEIRPDDRKPRPGTEDLGPGGKLLIKDGAPFVLAAFDRDGQRVFAVDEGAQVLCWNAAGFEQFRLHVPLGQKVSSAALSVDGRRLAIAGIDGALSLVEVRTRAVEAIQEASGPGQSALWNIAFSPDGRWLAAARGSREVQLWNLATRRLERSIRVGGEQVVAVAFAPDGLTLAAGDGRGGIFLFEVGSGKALGQCAGHGRSLDLGDFSGFRWSVANLAFARDGRTLASGGHDRTLRLWDTATRGNRHTVGHPRTVSAVAFHPAGRIIASGCADGEVRVWESATGQQRGGGLRNNPRPDQGAIRSLSFSGDGSRLVLAAGGRVELYEVERRVFLSQQDRTPLPILPPGLARIEVGGGHWPAEIGPLTMSRDRARVAFWGKDNRVRIWHSSTLERQCEITTHEMPRALAFHPTQPLLALGRGSAVILHRSDSGQEVGALRSTGWMTVHALDFSPDGRYLVSGHGAGFPAGEVRLWDVEARREVRPWTAHPGGVAAVAFTPDGLGVVTAGVSDPAIRLWEVASGRECLRLKGHRGGTAALAFAPDGKTLASAGQDGVTILWDTTRWRERFRLDGHPGGVHALAFAPDGKTLTTVGADRKLRFWDVPSACLLLTQEQPAMPRGTGFGPGGQTVLVRCADGTLDRWDAERLAPLKKRPAPVVANLDRVAAPEVPDLSPAGRVEPHLAAVVAADKGVALLFTRDRLVMHYSYPEWQLQGAYWLGALVYRAVLDPARGLVYAAVTPPRLLRTGRPGGPAWEGKGDLHIYDVSALLAGKQAPPRWKPVVISLDAQVGALALSEDGKWLAYLDEKDPFQATVKRIDTTARKVTGVLDLPGRPTAIATAVDGATLLVAGQGKPGGKPGYLVAAELRSFKMLRSVEVEAAAQDLMPSARFALTPGTGPAGQGLYFLDAETGKTQAHWRAGLPGPLVRQAGRRLYLLQRFGPPRLLAYDLPDIPVTGIPTPVETLEEMPTRPLGNDMLLTGDGKFLVMNSGQIFRLLAAGVQLPTASKPAGPAPAGKLRSLGIWEDGHSSRVLAVACSPLGRQVATGGDDRTLLVRHLDSGKIERTQTADGGVHALAWSPDGRYLAAASWGGTTSVLSTPAYHLWQQKRGGRAAGVDTICFTPDSVWLASGGDHGLIVWAIGSRARPTSSEVRLDTPTALTGVAVARGTGQVAAGDTSGKVRRFDLATGKELAAIEGHPDEVRAVAFRGDGQWLASADVTGKLKIHDSTGRQKHALDGHRHAILCLAVAPDGKLLASGSADGEVRLWDAETGKHLLTQPSRRNAPVYALAFSPDGKVLLAACGRQVHRWDSAHLLGPLLKVKPAVTTPVAVRPPPGGLVARLVSFQDAVIDPEAGMALVLTRTGTVRRYSYPDFQQEGYYRTDRTPFRLVLDRPRDLVHIVRGTRLSVPADLVPRGEEAELLAIERKEIKPALGKASLPLKPTRRLPLATTVRRVVLSADGQYLYYEDVKSHQIGRVDLVRWQRAGQVAFEESLTGMSLSPDGKVLYATTVNAGATSGKLHQIDTGRFVRTTSVDLRLAPTDVVAGNDGFVAVTGQGAGQVSAQVVRVGATLQVVREARLGEAASLMRWPDGKYALVCPRRATPFTIPVWPLFADAPARHKVLNLDSNPPLVGGDVVLSPDGKHLLFRSGAVLGIPPGFPPKP